MVHTPRPFFKQGPTPQARLVFFGLLSLILLFTDLRYAYLGQVREQVSALLYPLQWLATRPVLWTQTATEFVSHQGRLLRENQELRRERLQLAETVQREAALRTENTHLRQLAELPVRTKGKVQVAEILYTGRDPFTRRVIINRGAREGLAAGQAVLDNVGVIGQVTRAHALVSEVTLLTHKNHAVPVQVVRNGLRTVAYGTGHQDLLELRFMPDHADVAVGDKLATSGLDGVYPQGLQVATVVSIEKGVQGFSRILCRPAAGVLQYREVAVLLELPQALPPPEVIESVHPADKPGRVSKSSSGPRKGRQ